MRFVALVFLVAALAATVPAQQRADVPTMEMDGSAQPPSGPTTLGYVSQFPEEFVRAIVVLENVRIVSCTRVNNAEATGFDIPGDSYRIALYDMKSSGGGSSRLTFFASGEGLGRQLIAHKGGPGAEPVRVTFRVDEPVRIRGARPSTSYSATVVKVEWLDEAGRVTASVP